MSVLRCAVYENPSSEVTRRFSIRWFARNPGNGYYESNVKLENLQSALNCLDRQIEEADKGHNNHCSSMDDLWHPFRQ